MLTERKQKRLCLSLSGAVQGVGFRPLVFRLARDLELSGWVLNDADGLRIEAEGDARRLTIFVEKLRAERPAAATVAAVDRSWIAPRGDRGFQILGSDDAGGKSAWILPDLATCPECLKEISTPGERRFKYPFTNCTRCGPRFSIVTGIPYDRPATTMNSFTMCLACLKEYGDPGDRRFHAQPIACPRCGPTVWLETSDGSFSGVDGIGRAASMIRSGMTVALKAIGGFQLLCDARSEEAVKRLRKRKRREEKPFALMFPSVRAVRDECVISDDEEEWLISAAAPIVLLRRTRNTAGSRITAAVAPENPRLGVMLPGSPLHHLLMEELRFPVVATSGNLSEEPILVENDAARRKLGRIADGFLMHDRTIARHADDSIVRAARGRRTVLRRARGLAPLPTRVRGPLRPVLALGAHLKSTVSIGWEDRIVTSQHLGDLSNAASWDAFQAAVKDLSELYDFKPEFAVCDLHPDYLSTQFAENSGLPIIRVQHHHAHIAACAAEQDIEPPMLGVAFDGLGLGPDGTLWGGDFLTLDESGYRRVGSLRTFALPGGAAAVREPRRAALGILAEAGLDVGRLESLFDGSWPAMRKLSAGGSGVRTSSAGRLFDAVACLAGLSTVNSFEAQAAMALENVLPETVTTQAYPFPIPGGEADWEPLIRAVIDDVDRGETPGLIAARFHNALVRVIVDFSNSQGLERVVLSGGVFQNAYLLETSSRALEKQGFSVFSPRELPPNDGGISVGQAFLAGKGWGTELQ